MVEDSGSDTDNEQRVKWIEDHLATIPEVESVSVSPGWINITVDANDVGKMITTRLIHKGYAVAGISNKGDQLYIAFMDVQDEFYHYVSPWAQD